MFYCAWDLDVAHMNGGHCLLAFGPHSGLFYIVALFSQTLTMTSFGRVLWHPLLQLCQIQCHGFGMGYKQLCIHALTAPTDQDYACVDTAHFLTELCGTTLQVLLPLSVIMYAHALSLESCTGFSSILRAVPAPVMEYYTPEAPEPKRSWDQRPTLPRRRPSMTAASASPDEGQSIIRRPLPRLRRRDPLPRLKTLKASSLLRLRKLQTRLRDATSKGRRGPRKPLPRLRAGPGYGLSQELQDALPDVPTGSHLVELIIQGRPVQFWDVSNFPVPADQPMDTDDEIPGDANQGLYGIFPTRVLGRVSGDDIRDTKSPVPTALRYAPKKRKAGKKSTGTPKTTATSSSAKAKPHPARKVPKKARGSTRESLVTTPAAVTPPASEPPRPRTPQLRAAKCKAAATSGMAKASSPVSSSEDADSQRRLMNARCAELLEAQRAALRRRVELRKEAIRAASAKAKAASTSDGGENGVEEAHDETMNPLSGDGDRGGATDGDVQPGTELTSGQPSLPSAYTKCAVLLGLFLYALFTCCSLALPVYFQVMLEIAEVSFYVTLAGTLMYWFCSIIRWMARLIMRQLQRRISDFTASSVTPWLSYTPCFLDWQQVWSCVILLFPFWSDLFATQTTLLLFFVIGLLNSANHTQFIL